MSVKNRGTEPGTLPQGITEEQAASAFEGLFSETEETAAPANDTEENSEQEEQQEEEQAEESEEQEPEESEESEEQAEQTQEPQTFRVKIDGQEQEVTLDELRSGYSRTQDYTRKTQALAEQRRAMEADAAAYREQRGQYSAALEQMSAMLAQNSREPDWEQVQRDNPTEFPAIFARWQKHKEQRATIEAERARLRAEEFTEAQQRHSEVLSGEREKLLTAIPSWRDPAVRQKEQREIVEFARSHGFSDAEIAAVTDHRAVMLMRAAMEGHKFQQKKIAAKGKVEKVKAATPGATKTATASTTKARQIEAARARLKKSGSLDDAAALFLLTDTSA